MANVTTEQRRESFADLAGRRFMLLTTFRRDGTPVPTPVGIYLIGDRLFFLTDPRSGKAKRMRRNPHVTIAPCTMRGAVTGSTRHARVRPVTCEEAVELAKAFAGERPVTYHLGRILYDLHGKQTAFYEVVPTSSVRPHPLAA